MKQFIKEWELFTLFILLFGLSRLFLWQPVKVDGHSMDPTLAHGERLIIFNKAKIDRFDIVVASEEDENGQRKEIVKRVVGMPGDKLSYRNDTLYINNKKTKEPYLDTYLTSFKRTNYNQPMLTVISSKSWLKMLLPLPSTPKEKQNLTSLFQRANISYWVMTALYLVTAARSAPLKAGHRW